MTDQDWLDDTYMRKVLKHITDNQLKDLLKFEKAQATSKGENYFSSLVLVTVQYTLENDPDKTQELSLIVKSRLDNAIMAQIEEEFDVYSREMQFYTKIWNEAEKLLESIGKSDTKIAPKALYVDERIMVLENLKLQGFAIEDVKRGLNFEQCRLVVTKLAKFHALGMCLYSKHSDMFHFHLPGNVQANPSPIHAMYVNSIKTTIDYCKHYPGLSQYVPKLDEFSQTIIPKMINVFSRHQTDRYHVLNHGDVWVNNIMFKKTEDGHSEDVLFVDFQEGFYGSPGIDWNFFIFSSWQTEVFEKHFDALLELYHENLSSLLEQLEYDQRIPTIKDVQREILNKAYHGLATATCLLPIMINEDMDLADPANILLDHEEAVANRWKIFDNPAYGKRLEIFLEYFKKNGLL